MRKSQIWINVLIVLAIVAVISAIAIPPIVMMNMPDKEVEIIKTYHQDSWGEDWTTVVEYEGVRYSLSGNLGEPGETIKVRGFRIK